MKKNGVKKESSFGIFNTPYEPFLYILPFLIGLLIFTVYPIINVVLISFKENYKLLTGAYTGFGLDNYAKVIADPYFQNGVRNTLIYAVTVVPISTILSLLFATLLNQKIKGIGFFQTLYFLPMVTSSLAVGLAWKLMFNESFGVINSFLGVFGLGPYKWLIDPNMNIYTLIIFGIWNMMPMTIILLLSGLQNIDPMYATAARVDGASTSKIFFRITVPLLAPTIGLTMILNTISSFKVYGQLFSLFNGRPGIARNLYTAVYYIYDQFYNNWKLGKAAAASMLLFIVIFAITMIQKRLQKRWSYY